MGRQDIGNISLARVFWVILVKFVMYAKMVLRQLENNNQNQALETGEYINTLEALSVHNAGSTLVVSRSQIVSDCSELPIYQIRTHSCLEIHICWKVERDAKMEPPIQTEYFRSGGAMILTFMEDGARAVISFCIRSEIPGYMVVPPD